MSQPPAPSPQPSTLTFMMGEFEARFPTDRQYAKNHMWGQQRGDVLRFGFSAYAVRLLQDVYFLEWDHEEATPVKERQKVGFIESSKAESDLYAPISGTLTTINQQLLADPSAINTDKYAAGWIFEIAGPGAELLSASGYIEHLESVWDLTQKTIKGQLNE